MKATSEYYSIFIEFKSSQQLQNYNMETFTHSLIHPRRRCRQ